MVQETTNLLKTFKGGVIQQPVEKGKAAKPFIVLSLAHWNALWIWMGPPAEAVGRIQPVQTVFLDRCKHN
jgi:hypothetical protein